MNSPTHSPSLEKADPANASTPVESPTKTDPSLPSLPDETVNAERPKPSLVEASSPTPTKSQEEQLVNSILHFLSTADAPTLGVVGAGLAASTYLILGRVGLVLIGAFAGVVLFIQWERNNTDVSRAVKGEKSVELIERLLQVRKDIAASNDTNANTRDDDAAEIALLDSFSDFQPETRDALNELVDAITRDYVKWWYSPLVPADRSFPLSCRKVLSSFIVSVSNHVGRKRPADAFLDFLTHTSSIVIVFFAELATAFQNISAESGTSAIDAVYDYLASNPDCNLANLLSQQQQASKFRMVAEDLLSFLDRSIYDCDPARVFLREILAGVVLEMTLQTCSKPEWINGWIVCLLEAGEPDFNQAIDVGMAKNPDMNAFVDLDGNVGNVAVAKPRRKVTQEDRARHKENIMKHVKTLSRAREEDEAALEEMRKLNAMIAEEEESRKARESQDSTDAARRLSDALERNAKELHLPNEPHVSKVEDFVCTGEKQAAAELSPEDTLDSPMSPQTSAPQSAMPLPKDVSGGPFTSFDQFVPSSRLTIPDSEEGLRRPPSLTLYNASITLHDDSANNKARIRIKPTWDYLVQVEPVGGHYPGWMVVRKYADFETLHEIIRRIATVSGATAFTQQHSALPDWKVHTRGSLRGELERYVRDACWYQALAESEGMKRFFEKTEQGHARSESKSFGGGIETFGKNLLGAVTNAPKGALEGGKAFAGGVTGVLGNIGLPMGQRKSPTPIATTTPQTQPLSAANRNSMPSMSRLDSLALAGAGNTRPRDSLDSQRSSVVSTQPGKEPPMSRRPSYNSQSGDAELASLRPLSDRWDRPSPTTRSSREHSRASSLAPMRSPSALSLEGIHLPPPPNEMPDDYDSPFTSESPSRMTDSVLSKDDSFNSGATSHSSLGRLLPQNKSKTGSEPAITATASESPAKQPIRSAFQPLSEPETRVAVELVFAMINELYTLSGAWNFRRTLLAAAKSFLLRPGNPSLLSIQEMIQSSVLDGMTSDAGLASQLKKVRENVLPTEEERASWPTEMSDEEKEKLRVKARKLLIESGVPAALTGVMGQAATSEALGRVFDALQSQKVARGLIFGVMLQAVRVVTH